MQTTKFLFVIGTAALLTAPLTVTAGPDTEAQAKLREAMRQKMAELEGKTNPAPAPVVVAPVTPAPAPRTPTVVVPVPVEPAAAAPVAAPKSNSKFSEVADPADEAAAAKLREALRQQLATTPQPAPVVPAEPAKPAAPAKPRGNTPAPVFSAPPTVTAAAPASPLTGSKQDRLAELLRRYKADAITPQEYHMQRAKILAE